MSPAATTTVGWLSSRRNVVLAGLFAIALSLALAFGIYNRGGFGGTNGSPGGVGDAARQAFNQGVSGINAIGDTVAGLFGSRSPGQREGGTLANMKQRKRPALHQRALPKVRGGPLAAIVGASPVPPPVPPASAPLYNVVTDSPKAGVPGTPIALTPGSGGGPTAFPGLTPLPGGGGVIVPPPVTIGPPETPTTPTTPTIPTNPASPVPEPGSWLLMLLGFVSIGAASRGVARRSLPT